MTHSPRTIHELLDRHGLKPSRALGQNFVADPNTVRRIARLARVGPGDQVLEIGPGLGSLTLALAETGASIVAVERDRYMLAALTEVVKDLDVRIVEGDALDLDWPGALGAPGPWHLVANLPYNIATGLVLDLLADVPAIETMLVMVQREVAERLVAGPGSRTYGIPSVKVAYWGSATLEGRVPPTVFVPQPRVESALVRIVRHSTPVVDTPVEELFALVEAGFGQRRKMLRRALSHVVTAEMFAAAEIDPEARAERLSLEAWARLADARARMG